MGSDTQSLPTFVVLRLYCIMQALVCLTKQEVPKHQNPGTWQIQPGCYNNDTKQETKRRFQDRHPRKSPNDSPWVKSGLSQESWGDGLSNHIGLQVLVPWTPAAEDLHYTNCTTNRYSPTTMMLADREPKRRGLVGGTEDCYWHW